jgi:adenylate cyclase
MDDSEPQSAWLEQSTGRRVPMVGTCSIGRLSSNNIVLSDERVSRRHAIINVQDEREFWLVDLGSGNGTYLNGRRVVQPTRLSEGDTFEIASFKFSFHQGVEAPIERMTSETTAEGRTLQNISSTECWLMVADIEDSTHLMRTLSPVELPRVTGRWLDDCKRLVEKCGGSINKFLGDGFLAYWHHGPQTEAQVAQAMQDLAQMQRTAQLAFRVVLHFGEVFTGGIASMGEESLQGKEVHFVFRMEKLAGSMGSRFLLSEAAKNKLAERLPFTDAGSHPLAGFDGEHPFYSM